MATNDTDVVSLKRQRGLHAQKLSDVIKAMEKSMLRRNEENEAIVRDNQKVMEGIYGDFLAAHQKCEAGITEPSIMTELHANFGSVAKDYAEMQERIQQWMNPEKDGDDDGDDRQADVRSSASSQEKLRLAQEKLEIAEQKERLLVAQQTLARQKMELEQEKEALRQKCEVQEARKQAAKARAEMENDEKSDSPIVQETFSQKTDDTFGKLADALNRGFCLPQPEIETFDGQPSEYSKFVHCFESTIETRVKDNKSRLMYLIQQCKGEAKRAIEMCGMLDPEIGYKKAREILQSRYGRPHIIARSCIDKLVQGPEIKARDVTKLSDLALEMQRCEIILSQLGFASDIDNSENLRRLVRRLPVYMRKKWVNVAHNIVEGGREPKFSDLAKFVDDLSKVANSMYGLDFVDENPKRPKIQNQTHSKGPQNKVTTLTTQSGKNETSRKCVCCDGDCRYLDLCEKFKSYSIADRKQLIRRFKLCDNCLKGKHFARDCRKEKMCKVPECQFKHHGLLHEWSQKLSVNCAATSSGVSNFLGIVPVMVEGGNGVPCLTYALLDDASDKTLCSEQLLRDLQVNGKTVSFSIASVGSKETAFHGSEVDLIVKPVDGSNDVPIRHVWSVKDLPISQALIATDTDVKKWSHLSDITLPKIPRGSVTLLIGTDAPKAHVPLEVRSGNNQEPYAVRTALGWAVRGPRDNSSCNRINVNFITRVSNADAQLHSQLEQMWKTDFNEKMESDETMASIEDVKAQRLIEESTTITEDGHYEIGLPWKDVNTKQMPNNRAMAEKRLNSLKGKLLKNEELKHQYTDVINGYIDRGYARKAGPPGNGRVWYLPHHGVLNPNKPKVRVVFDAAAKYHNISLNSQLMQGPDLTNDLVGVLIRFRQEKIAITSDVEQMFHQVRVKKEDQDALRFLWWPDGNLCKSPEEYCMCVHIFGATSSPSCAAYALRRAAIDQTEQFDSSVVSTIQRNFYVDDCLKSVETTEEALALSRDLCCLLSNRGFHLTKWISNDKEVLEAIPPEERAKSVTTLRIDDTLPCERALGVSWNVNDDVFQFDVNIMERPYTRRGLLSVVSALYDPLGLVAPVTLPAKALLQNLCKIGLAWDEEIPEASANEWVVWLKKLQTLSNLQIPRCYKDLQFEHMHRTELHVFCDASEKGYGSCVYLRLKDSKGETSCRLVMGKSRLTPIRAMSLPRLELTAAVLGARLASKVKSELEVAIDETILWSDSMIVIGYINNTTRRFKTFVANRLSTIHAHTTPSQWRHIEGKSNPADIASRGVAADDTRNLNIWVNGPRFLYTTPDCWPKSAADKHNLDDDVEVKRDVTVALTVKGDSKMNQFIERYSDWTRLLRGTVWLQRFIKFLKMKYLKRECDGVERGWIMVKELKLAEKAVCSYVQKDAFPEEWRRLSSGKPVLKDSRIASLEPILIDDVIRVGGRLHHATQISHEAKHPIILEKHHVTSLIITQIHEDMGHMGTNQVLASVRSKYWILKGRNTVRKVLKQCMVCKKVQSRPCEQQMAPLLQEQVTPDRPPFTFIGIDFFGPMRVKMKRSTTKRYGCVFTCLTTRAVHIEIAHSLSTDSFIAACNRFISRRGTPEKIYSDNGTNFVGGEREMREELEKWNREKINEQFVQKRIEWHFNPPHASHMGGAFERIIRTTRKILSAVVNDQLLDDEQLQTVMAEVEKILNDRPLTYVSDDPTDPEVLTPNKLLLLRDNSCLPMGKFDKSENYTVRRWRQAQHIANVFWRRWLREYIPSLQIKTKWQRSQRNVKEGDVVMVALPHTPRGHWPLGRVISVNLGRDSLVRSCTIKSKTGGEITRPITDIHLLEAC